MLYVAVAVIWSVAVAAIAAAVAAVKCQMTAQKHCRQYHGKLRTNPKKLHSAIMQRLIWRGGQNFQLFNYIKKKIRLEKTFKSLK